jgi:hypothetical protein
MKKKGPENLLNESKIFESSVGVGVKLDEPERTKYFESEIKKTKNHEYAKKLQLLLKRIKVVEKHVDGFLPEENTKFQNETIRGFHHKLTDKFLIEYLRYEQRRLESLAFEIKKEMDSLPTNMFDPYNRYGQLYATYAFNSRYSQWLTEINKRLELEKPYWNKVQNRGIKTTNEMVAGFCKLVHESTLPYRKKENEGAEVFCSIVCKVYNLPYKTRVRIAYSQPVTVLLASKIERAILPSIPAPDREKILKVIDLLSDKN